MTADSRAVKPGDLFVAVPGTKADGMRFAAGGRAGGRRGGRRRDSAAGAAAGRRRVRAGRQCAARAGAGRSAALSAPARRPSPRSPAPAARPRSPPSRGRSGRRSGMQAASIGTIGVVSPKSEIYGSLTTPDPVGLHRTLDEARGRGRHASRDGGVVARPRPAPARRRAGRGGGFTNLEPRPSRLSSRASKPISRAKLRLFEELVGRRRHRGDRRRSRAQRARWSRRRSSAGCKLFTVGREGDGIRLIEDRDRRLRAGLTLAHARQALSPCICRWSARSRSRTRWSPAGLAIATGGDRRTRCSRRWRRSKAPRAGSNSSASANGAPIFVDYAHKPDALAKALEALRPYVKAQADRGVRRRRQPRCRQAAR